MEMIGQTIQGYKILRKIGEGGMGIVYLAENDFELKVAIKTLKPEFSKDRKMLNRFKAEAQAMRRLQGHPNIVQIQNVCEQDGQIFLIMEYLDDGTDLNTLVSDKGPVTDAAKLKEWLSQILGALNFAHNLSPKIIHRDIKPSNLFLTKFGQIKLLDFGIVKVLEDSSDPDFTLKTLTSTTSKIGSINFMSPEQSYDAKLVDERSDIYSLGKTLKAIMTAGNPFNKISEEPFKTIIKKCTEECPDDRYQTVEEIVTNLGSSLHKDTISQDIKHDIISLQSKPLTVYFEMVFVKGGTFWMGAQCKDQNKLNYDEDANSDESPVHQVTLSDFAIGKYPVTQAQWKAVMGSNPSCFKCDDLPVENVSWEEVQEFIRELNTKTGKQYRLPTEAEWEYASRGGNQSRGYKYSGSNNIDEVAWYEDNSGNQTHAVGTKQPNELGIYDMSGNVWEWCNDWYGDYSRSSQTNPQGANSGSGRVRRGGSWFNYAGYCRVANRGSYTPDYRGRNLGFRLALVQ